MKEVFIIFNFIFIYKLILDLGSRINQMEDALEKLAKRDKLLDNANKELKERNSLLSEEYSNLKKECKDRGI